MRPRGSVSMTVTGAGSATLPELRTHRRNVPGSPTMYSPTASFRITASRRPATGVLTVLQSFATFASPVVRVQAVLTRAATDVVAETVVAIVITTTSPAIIGTVRTHSTVCPLTVQANRVPEAAVGTTPTGSTSVMVMGSVVGAEPMLSIVMV